MSALPGADASSLMRHVRELAEVIGPRPSTSPQERRAAGYLEGALSSLGWRVEREPFRSVTSFSWAVLVVFGLSVAAAGLLPGRPAAALALTLAALALFVLEASSVAAVSRLLPTRPSQNLLASLPGGPGGGDAPGLPSAGPQPIQSQPPAAGPRRGATQQAVAGPLRRLIVVAHYDSSREAVLYHPLLVPAFRALFLAMVGSMLVIALASILALGAPALDRWFMPPAWAAGGYLAAMFLVVLHRETLGRPVAGANDNASGAAVALGLAERLARAPTTRLEVQLLFTGAEEAGTVGMLSFLARHGRRLRGGPATAFLNLDNLGKGSLRYIVAEGMLNLTRSDAELVGAASRVAVERPDLGFGPAVYQSLTTDGLAAMMRGFRAMGIMAFDARGILPNWHWRTDTCDGVDPGNLDRALEFVEGLVRELDRKAGEQRPGRTVQP
ncbi:MAG: M28 family peptidase [Acetobacteraceae bacterium]|nr:M28 family peptidase [Acetobacteraceae bacterium]